MIRVKRVYESPSRDDGSRILVDRLWPRGLRKDQANIDLWLKDVAPSSELRKWFGHDPQKWPEFKKRYFRELKAKQEDLQTMERAAKKGNLTLLYSSREERYNNAVALEEYLDKDLKGLKK